MENTTVLITENSALFLQTQQPIDFLALVLYLGMLLKDKTILFFLCNLIPSLKKTNKKIHFWKCLTEILLCFCLFKLYWSFLGSCHFHSLQSSRRTQGAQTAILIDLLTTSNPLIHVPLSPGTSCWSWQSACWEEPPPWWHYRHHTGRSRCSRWTYGRTLAPLRSLQRARISTRKEFWNSPPLCKEA